jgi:AcrR family transcriptional regulator
MIFSIRGNRKQEPMTRAKRGPRPAGTDTREAILEAAREQFSELGYRRATLRSVGAAAGVDPRLVLHYFGSKRDLFAQAVRLPVDPDALMSTLFDSDEKNVPERVAEVLLAVLENPETRQSVLAIVRAAASEPEAAEVIRVVLTDRVLMPLTTGIGLQHPELRASFIGALFVGLTMARYVVGVEPLASAPPEQVVRALTPVIEHYLHGDWTPDDLPSRSGADGRTSRYGASGSPS